MKMSQLYMPTLREVPSDADIMSAQLLLRAGMIRKLVSGVYSFLPLGFRAMKKIESIVREEMNNSGAIELLMPVIQPAEIWQQSPNRCLCFTMLILRRLHSLKLSKLACSMMLMPPVWFMCTFMPNSTGLFSLPLTMGRT